MNKEQDMAYMATHLFLIFNFGPKVGDRGFSVIMDNSRFFMKASLIAIFHTSRRSVAVCRTLLVLEVSVVTPGESDQIASV